MANVRILILVFFQAKNADAHRHGQRTGHRHQMQAILMQLSTANVANKLLHTYRSDCLCVLLILRSSEDLLSLLLLETYERESHRSGVS